MDKLKLFDVIKYPIVTDKASALNKNGKKSNKNFSKLVICVDLNANKKTIKEAVESIFGVKVLDVNTMIVQGKTKLSARKYKFKRSETKKAVVTISNDSSLEGLSSLVEGSPENESVNNFVSQDIAK